MYIALIRWGAQTVGKRPSTALAVVRQPKGLGAYPQFMGRPYCELIRDDGRPRFPRGRVKHDFDVLYRWPDDYFPTPRERKEAKKSLSVICD